MRQMSALLWETKIMTTDGKEEWAITSDRCVWEALLDSLLKPKVRLGAHSHGGDNAHFSVNST